MNGTSRKTQKAWGSGEINENKPFGNNPFIDIPGDVDENPWQLVWLDLLSVFQKSVLLPQIVLPLWPNISGSLDELAPTFSNTRDIILHMTLLTTQTFTIIALPIAVTLFCFLPGMVYLAYGLIFLAATMITMRLLNGRPTTECLVGMPDGMPANDEHELWYFINGVATGKHWLQNNLNLLARTFQREVVGIHNPTFGFLFDLIECLIQRDLDFKTHDIRQARSLIRKALAAPSTTKLVLILHSQGGIEGSSMLDWLLADLSYDLISKMEIFTFGNAARHFNNPLIDDHTGVNGVDESKGGRGQRVIKHIEHYANSNDFVANIGVLAFTSPENQPFTNGNAFFGTVFKRKGTGHLLNMHYLDTMFTMADGKVDEDGNDFMNSSIPQRHNGALTNSNSHHTPKRIRDVSRLWQYINGKKPKD